MSVERYVLYSHLARLGYAVKRHPARWALGAGEVPLQVWGQGGGAWHGCDSCTAAAAGSSTEHAVGSSQAARPQATPPPPPPPHALWPQLASGDTNGGVACSSRVQAMLLRKKPRLSQPAAGGSGAATPWWGDVAAGGIDWLQGIDLEAPPHDVLPDAGASVRAAHPRLRPLPVLGEPGGAALHLPAPSGSAHLVRGCSLVLQPVLVCAQHRLQSCPACSRLCGWLIVNVTMPCFL